MVWEGMPSEPLAAAAAALANCMPLPPRSLVLPPVGATLMTSYAAAWDVAGSARFQSRALACASMVCTLGSAAGVALGTDATGQSALVV